MCVRGVLGLCQSIDDGAETALTGGLQDPVDFQGVMKFSKNICEPSKISLLCIPLNVMSFSKWASIASTTSNPDAALLIVCHFTQPCLTCFSLAHKIDGTNETGGHMSKF